MGRSEKLARRPAAKPPSEVQELAELRALREAARAVGEKTDASSDRITRKAPARHIGLSYPKWSAGGQHRARWSEGRAARQVVDDDGLFVAVHRHDPPAADSMDAPGP